MKNAADTDTEKNIGHKIIKKKEKIITPTTITKVMTLTKAAWQSFEKRCFSTVGLATADRASVNRHK